MHLYIQTNVRRITYANLPQPIALPTELTSHISFSTLHIYYTIFFIKNQERFFNGDRVGFDTNIIHRSFTLTKNYFSDLISPRINGGGLTLNDLPNKTVTRQFLYYDTLPIELSPDGREKRTRTFNTHIPSRNIAVYYLNKFSHGITISF